jgi:hypothetical protein
MRFTKFNTWHVASVAVISKQGQIIYAMIIELHLDIPRMVVVV